MTPEEIAEEIDVLVRMKMLGEQLLGKAFFDTLAYAQIRRKLAELRGTHLVTLIEAEAEVEAENLKKEESKKLAEMRAAHGI